MKSEKMKLIIILSCYKVYYCRKFIMFVVSWILSKIGRVELLLSYDFHNAFRSRFRCLSALCLRPRWHRPTPFVTLYWMH